MWIFAVSVLIVYLLPYLVLGSQGSWMIWDNLDGLFVMYKVLVESGALFAPNSEIVMQPLGGIPRGTLPSEFDFFVWLYLIFGPEAAYIINRVFMTVIAFIGMHLLLSKHVLEEWDAPSISIGVALCFAILPFWPFGGLSVAGQPLVLFALLNIRTGDYNWKNWLIISLYPFYSSLILSGVFFLMMVTLIWLYDTFRKRQSWALFGALSLIFIIYVISHYRLFIDFLISPDYITHRVEFVFYEESSFKEALKVSIGFLFRSLDHAHTLHNKVILPWILISSMLVIFSKPSRQKAIYIVIGVGLVFISLIYGFKSWPGVTIILQSINEILPMQLDRFYFLGPMLWMIVFAISLAILVRQAYSMQLVIIGLIGAHVLYSLTQHELVVNRYLPSSSSFFAESQFNSIKERIGYDLDSYRVASIGIHPSVSLYNGFYTVDGYWHNYPLVYKHQFRRVIENELNKDSSLMEYYDTFGSRVYMYNAVTKLDMEITKHNQIILDDVDYNWSALYELGGRYVFSALPISNENNNGLLFVDKFSDSQSAWNVYLYKVCRQEKSMIDGKPIDSYNYQ